MDAWSPEGDRLRSGEDRPGRLRQLAGVMLGGYAVAVVAVAAAAFAALDLSAAVRSYLSGESLWAKAQRDAVFALDEYAANGEEADWGRYLSALRIPLGDRQARVELQKPDPDLERVREGFVRGGLSPEETDGMIRLYRWFGWLGPVERAVAVWARGDSLIQQLHREASVLRREWEPPPPDTAVVQRTMERVDSLNAELTQTELQFSKAMIDASRLIERVALWAVGGLTVLLLLGGTWVTVRVYRELRSREEAIRRAQRRYRRIFSDSQDAIYVTDRDGTIVEMNPAGLELFGYSADELQSVNAEELYHDPEDRARFKRRIEEEGEVEGFEVKLETREGTVLDCELTSTARTRGDEIVGYQGIIRDVTERKRAKAELEWRALHDPLTGLPNRNLLWDRLEQAVARSARAGGPLAVLFVDLDGFKVVNDDISHAAGDRVLVKVGGRLSDCVRDPDTVARVGGDEFVVLLEDMERARHAERVAERIGQALEAPFRVADHDVHLDASIGIAELADRLAAGESPEEIADELVRRADQAMYRAKESRGTTARRYRPADRVTDSRIERENELRRAVQSGELVVHYQPVVDLRTGAAVAFEALVRWRHPERGLLFPDEFLDLAEETGLVVDLGRQVLEASCRRVARWNREFRPDDPLRLHVNLSAAQFEDADLGDQLDAVLPETGFPARLLELEIAEHTVTRAPGRAHEISEAGVGVYIDDFGTGHSSLSSVKEVSATGLKVDMSFVHGLGENPEDEAIVRTVLTLGRSLDLELVAEGIETSEQLRWLRGEECPRGQGHLFARPAPAEEVSARLEAGGRYAPRDGAG